MKRSPIEMFMLVGWAYITAPGLFLLGLMFASRDQLTLGFMLIGFACVVLSINSVVLLLIKLVDKETLTRTDEKKKGPEPAA